jgi:murein DD-endopeptidase MepM/ murein hydrolase activator NlpD
VSLRPALVIVLAAFIVAPGGARGETAPGSQSPSLVPFVGSFKISATWGAPSGGYHAQPAVDVKMKSGTPVYATGAGTVGTIKRDTSRCNPRDHGATTAEGVRWCLDHGYAESGTRIVLRHPDGRLSSYLHLSSVVRSLAEGQAVRAGQLIGHSGNTGISEAPHLHYEERASGKPVDPGVWIGCSSGKRVEYDRLQHRVNEPVANEGYGCLGIDGGQQDPPSNPLRALAGTWSGEAVQNRVPPFTVIISLRNPVATTVGVAEIPSRGCAGSVRYLRTDGKTHRFRMTWQRGTCIKGIMSLTALGSRTLLYRWEGRYSDGSRAASRASLQRVDKLRVSFLGPATSRYSSAYWADVTGARRMPSGAVGISFSATGRSDLRKPGTSCLIHRSSRTKASVRAANLTTNSTGRYVGELEFSVLQAGTWLFQYSCSSDYTSPAVLRVGS